MAGRRVYAIRYQGRGSGAMGACLEAAVAAAGGGAKAGRAPMRGVLRSRGGVVEGRVSGSAWEAAAATVGRQGDDAAGLEMKQIGSA